MTTDRRVRNLDRRGLVAAVFVATLLLFLWNMLRSDIPYTDPRFVIAFFSTEVQVTVWLTLVTAALFPWTRLGFRVPRLRSGRHLWPLVVLLVAAAGAWMTVRGLLPAGVIPDNGASRLALRTTLLVGLNEEWIFRGLVFAALSRWMGLRRGAFGSVLLFGGFHLLNLGSGVPVAMELVQVVITITIGSAFLLAAFGTCSLWIPALAHAFYDFFVLDMARLVHQGGSPVPSLVLMVVGLLVGVASLIAIGRLEGEEPYAD